MSIGTIDPPVLVAAARHGLTSDRSTIALDASEGVDVVNRARHDHLSGFLAAAVLDGVITVDDDMRAMIMQRWHEEMLGSVLLEALAVRTARILDHAAVVWRLTKGAALAHLDYPDPSVRTFGDVDVVVHPDHWITAIYALLSNGYTREAEALPADYDRRYGKGATLTTIDNLEVDLHRRFAIGRFGVTSRMGDVFGAHDTILLAGRSVAVFSPAHRLLHACYHASLGGFRNLRPFRDVAQLILITGADWEETFAVARRWRAEAVVATAIVECWQKLQLEVEHAAHDRAASLAIGRGDGRALEVFRLERPFRAQALTSLGRLPITEVPRFVWSLTSHRLARCRR